MMMYLKRNISQCTYSRYNSDVHGPSTTFLIKLPKMINLSKNVAADISKLGRDISDISPNLTLQLHRDGVSGLCHALQD